MTEAAQVRNEHDDVSLDRKLVCLSAWLERTTQKESQAAQARALLPASALTVGAALAAAFVSIGERWFGACGFVIMLINALVLFLYHQRQCAVWRRVAHRLQDEQKHLLMINKPELSNETGRHTSDELAHFFGRKEPIRYNSMAALGLYLTAFVLAMLLMLFAITEDYKLLQPRESPASSIESQANQRAIL